MTPAELLPLLLGSTGALVFSLSLNWLFLKGSVTGSNSVPKVQHDRLLDINEQYAAKFGEQTEAIRALAHSQNGLADAHRRTQSMLSKRLGKP